MIKQVCIFSRWNLILLGSIEDMDLSGFTEAYNYYRSMYPKIEEKDIEEFSNKYRFSEEETQDVINYYNE